MLPSCAVVLGRASIAFTSGVVGAVANVLAATAAGGLGLLPAAPGTLPWLYQRLVWGGLFGLLLLAPALRGRPLARGLLVSLVPAAARLTLFAPPGSGLDARTLLGVLALNAVWGVAAALWYAAAAPRD